MADFVDDEAEETEEEEEEEEVNHRSKKRTKRSKAMEDSEEEEDDDEDRIREEIKDLINDDPIEESEGEDSDGSSGNANKRKKVDSDYDDQLEDDDYELLEENLGIAVDRKKRFKRLRRVQDAESDDENEPAEERQIIANQLFDAGSGDEIDRMSIMSHRNEDIIDDTRSESHYSDADDFIVDDEGRPITERRNKRPVFNDASLQEAQEIFGIDFDYKEFEQDADREASQEEEDDDEEDDEYIDDEQTERRRRKKTPKEKTKRNTIFDIYEPSELQRGHFTDKDHEMRLTDIPERMQSRSVRLTSVAEGSDELEKEADWIYRQGFCRGSISTQDAHLSEEAKERARKGPQTVSKIRKALDFMRNQNFEVPFISFYRKEYVLPELNINDLWKVYKFDAKWCELRQRKENLSLLFERMRDYQLDEILKRPDDPLPESTRVIKEEDIDRLKGAETSEEINDVYHHFMLYYSHEIPNMQQIIREKSRELRKEERLQKRRQEIYAAIERGEDLPAEDAELAESESAEETLKQAVRSGSYGICRRAGLKGLAKMFGLSPEDFAENVRDNYQRHEVEQEPIEPSLAALQFCSPQFNTSSAVLKAAEQMVAIELAREPLVRKTLREVYMERAKISVAPTKRGIKEIDENHPVYAMKYLKDKPVRELVGDTFLKLYIAEKDKLVSIRFSDSVEGTSSDNYVQELKLLYHRDEFSKNVRDWNALRASSVDLAIAKMVIPDLQKELRDQLLAEAREFVLRACCRKMYNWIKVAPYAKQIEAPVPPAPTISNNNRNNNDEENWEDDWDAPEAAPPPPEPEVAEKADKPEETTKGIRVMGLAYVPDFTQAAFACLVAANGECTDHLRLPNLTRRRRGREEDKELKEADLLAIRAFISSKRPDVIALGGESREAKMLLEDLKECLTILNTDEGFPLIDVEICENELAKIYAQSNRAVEEFREFPVILRQAISVARRLQDPLVEFSQLCSPDDEILCLKFHALQDQLPKEDLLENLQLEFVNRVNEVGVDINKAIQEGYSGNLLQFVCGLGSRKAQALIKTLKQTNQRIENRTQLVTTCHMGPKVFINCAGFVKIDTSSLGDSTEVYVEVLDGTRVHPETYEWARKMAVDALEYDDEEGNPAGALEDILKAPDRLKDLDLDAFAEELERQGFGNKATTLYDIRAELNCRYKDLRAPYESPTAEKLFDILTKETPESFYIGKLILATVTGFVYKKPEGETLDQANPVRNEATNLWQCPFCQKSDFLELSEVWGHFDTGECRGKAMGVRLSLDNGISGFIHVKNLSDKRVENPEERVRPGQVVHCRVIKIEVDRFSIECTSKSSDLADTAHELRPQRDAFYDTEAEEKDLRLEQEAKKLKQRAYMKRVIVHPSFHNISYAEAAKLLGGMKQGEAIIRPSSKGADHLTVTWKVHEDVLHHIDVREEGKKFGFSLGEKLWIGTEEYEDLDEILARHVNPMAGYAAELLECHYFKPNIDGSEAKAEEALEERKREKPSSIPCILSPSRTYPAKFLLSYLPREKCQHEYLTVTPDGVRYRGQIFQTIGKLFSWFKKHFREPRALATPKTMPTPAAYNQFTPHHTLSLTADETPHHCSMATPAIASSGGTPYTPSSKTPFLTPHQTPGFEFARPNAPPNHRAGSPADGARGRGRGRGGTRGNRGTYGRGSFDRNAGNLSNQRNSGDKTPLWDENESWDSPPDKENQKNSGNLKSTGKNGGQTPLWDESESWDSPGEASLPNDSLTSKASANSAPLWNENESWDAPTSNNQNANKNDSTNAALWAPSESWDSPPKNSTPSNAPPVPSWKPNHTWGSQNEGNRASNDNRNSRGRNFQQRGRNSYNSGDSSNYSSRGNRGGFSRGNKSWNPPGQTSFGDPTTSVAANSGATAPLWDASESWDTEDPAPPANAINRAPTNQTALTAPIVNQPLFDDGENWDADDPVPQIRTNSPKEAPKVPEVSNIIQSAPLWNESESWDTEDPVPQISKPVQSFNSKRDSAPAPIINAPLWDESESWDNEDPVPNVPVLSSQVPKFPDTAVISQTAPLWDESESWDNPEPAKTCNDSGNSASNLNASGNNSRNEWKGNQSWTSQADDSNAGQATRNSSFRGRGNNQNNNHSGRWNKSNNSDGNSGGNNWNSDGNSNRGRNWNSDGNRGRNWNSEGSSNRGRNWNSEESSNRGRNWNSEGSSNRGRNWNSDGNSNRGNWNSDGNSRRGSWNSDGNSSRGRNSNNRGRSGNFAPQNTYGAYKKSLGAATESWDASESTPSQNDRSFGQKTTSNIPDTNSTSPVANIASFWDESESWDTSEPPAGGNDQQGGENDRPAAHSTVNPPPIANIAPLWDESESWDTNEPSTSNNRSQTSRNDRQSNQNTPNLTATHSNDPPIVNLAPLWNENESWDTDEPTTGQNDRQKGQNDRQKGQNDRQRGQNDRQNTPAVSSTSNAPPIVNLAPLWNENESWDTDEPAMGQNDRQKGQNDRQRGQNDRQNTPAVNSTSTAPPIVNLAPLWNENESWDTDEPATGQNDRERGQNDRQRGRNDRQRGRNDRQRGRNDRQRGQNYRQRGQNDWQRNQNDPQRTENTPNIPEVNSASTVPPIPNTAPLWDESESWD